MKYQNIMHPYCHPNSAKLDWHSTLIRAHFYLPRMSGVQRKLLQTFLNRTKFYWIPRTSRGMTASQHKWAIPLNLKTITVPLHTRAIMHKSMTHIKILLFIILGMLVLTPILAAQSLEKNAPLTLSLSEAIQLALRNNPNVKTAHLQRVIDKYALVVADNEFAIRYQLTGNVFWNRTTFNKETESRHGAALSPQASIKAPVGLEFTASVPQTFSDDARYQPTATFSAKQPLLRGAGSAVNLVGYRNSYDQEEINKYQLKDSITNAIISVIRDFHALQQAQQSVTIQENNLKDAKDNLHQTQARINTGQLPPRDIVEIQRQIADQELQLEVAKNAYNQQKLVLLRDLWISPESVLVLPNDIDNPLSALPTLEQSYETALQHNSQYQTAIIGLQQDKRNLLLAEDQARWQLDVSASHQIGINAGSDANGSGLQNLFNGRNKSSQVALDLDIPIDNKPLKQGVINAKIRYKQNTLRTESIRRELYDAVKTAIADLMSQQKQIGLSEQATKLARQSLELENRKLLFGKSTQLDVTSARRTVISAENELVRNKINYLNTLTEFQRLLGTTLDHWQVTLDYS